MSGDPDIISVPGRTAEVAGVRRWLEDILSRRKVPTGAAADILSAVSEICNNIIRHGYKSDAAGEIRLEASFDAEAVTVIVTDDAPRYHPAPGAELPADQLAEGGYGLYLVNSLMDQVRYQSLGETGNRTTLVKNLPGFRDANGT